MICKFTVSFIRNKETTGVVLQMALCQSAVCNRCLCRSVAFWYKKCRQLCLLYNNYIKVKCNFHAVSCG